MGRRHEISTRTEHSAKLRKRCSRFSFEGVVHSCLCKVSQNENVLFVCNLREKKKRTEENTRYIYVKHVKLLDVLSLKMYEKAHTLVDERNRLLVAPTAWPCTRECYAHRLR